MKKSISQLIKESQGLILREHDLKNYWKANITSIKDSIAQSSNSDLLDLADHIEEIRGRYFMLSQSKIDEVYQGLAQVIISIKIKTKDQGVENYLRYFSPESAYYLRMKALSEFRLLANPIGEIEGKYNQTIELLYQSVQSDKSTLTKAREVLKEYIDRLFFIIHKSQFDRESWYKNMSSNSSTYQQFRNNDESYTTWLKNYIYGGLEVASDSGSDIDIDVGQSENADNVSELIQKLSEFESSAKTYTATIQEKDSIIIKLNATLEDKSNTIKQLEQKIALYSSDIQNYSTEKQALITQYEKQLQQLSHEKQNIQSEYDKYLILMNEVEKGQKELDDLRKENKELKYQLDVLKSIKEDKSIIEKDDCVNKHDRSTYRIDVIGGSDKVMKKYNNLQKNLDISDVGLDWKQLEVICDYSGQKTLKSSRLKDNFDGGRTTFVLAIQTDHETEFAELCKDPDYSHQITVFAEDKEYTGQSLSNDRFRHYLKLAIDKYERYVGNLVNL